MAPQAASNLLRGKPRLLRPVADGRDVDEAFIGCPDVGRGAVATRDGASDPRSGSHGRDQIQGGTSPPLPPPVTPNAGASRPTTPVPSESRQP